MVYVSQVCKSFYLPKRRVVIQPVLFATAMTVKPSAARIRWSLSYNQAQNQGVRDRAIQVCVAGRIGEPASSVRDNRLQLEGAFSRSTPSTLRSGRQGQLHSITKLLESHQWFLVSVRTVCGSSGPLTLWRLAFLNFFLVDSGL